MYLFKNKNTSGFKVQTLHDGNLYDRTIKDPGGQFKPMYIGQYNQDHNKISQPLESALALIYITIGSKLQ